MLTKPQSIQHYDFQNQRVVPDRLTRQRHSHYLPLAEGLVRIYRENLGQPRKHLHRLVERSLQQVDDCPTRRIAAFCKLLDDACSYRKDKAGQAAKLRQRVFTLAASKHPLVQTADQLFECAEQETKQSIASELGMSWERIQSRLFCDVIEYHPLESVPDDLDGEKLLRRYNVAQTQAALYDAISMTIWARQDFKTILRYAKLARLMHSIEQRDGGYVLRLSGPASVLRNTRRYGVMFAQFLPGLLSAQDWRMQANLLGPGKRRFAMQLTSNDGLQGEINAEDYDSQLEQNFAQQWQQHDTGQWQLRREATILHQSQKVFLADFTLVHPEHDDILLEIVGFWTPEYLKEKAKTLAAFRKSARILLAISESSTDAIAELDMPCVVYKTKLKPADVLAVLPSFK